MAKINRGRLKKQYTGQVLKKSEEVDLYDPIPDGERWQLSWVLFADESKGTKESGGFLVEFGEGTTWDFVAGAYLTGDTFQFQVNQIYIGDGVKHFRLKRINDSNDDKNMLIVVDGFKRIGDIV